MTTAEAAAAAAAASDAAAAAAAAAVADVASKYDAAAAATAAAAASRGRKEQQQQQQQRHRRGGGQQQQQQQRRSHRSGDASDFRCRQNMAKRYLLERAAARQREGWRGLDLCCGRGGDLLKWSDAGATEVWGVDVSVESITQANQRWRRFQENPDFKVALELWGGDAATRDMFRHPPFAALAGTFDVVACMFALQYFFDTEQRLASLLANAAGALAPGGRLVLVAPEGKRVLDALRGGLVAETEAYRLVSGWRDPIRGPYGNMYECRIRDSIIADGSREYLVNIAELTRVARGAGLLPDAAAWGDPRRDLFEPHWDPAARHARSFAASGRDHPPALNVAVIFRKPRAPRDLEKTGAPSQPLLPS